MKRIAIIPARGGSKRIPRKNIIDFMGKPLIAWTITAAIESKLFDRVIVSTDDAEFAEIATEYGAEVPFLRDNKSDDISPVSEATLVALKQAEEFYSETYQTVVQLMANAPMRTANDIITQVKEFEKFDRNFQLSCFQFGWMNPWWAVKLNEAKEPEWVLPEGFHKRSQDLPPLYCPTGVIWIAKAEQLKLAKTFYGEGYKFCEINWKAAVDIDDYEDLEFAKALFMLKNLEHQKA
jgi:CMP-N-acetylneuraminic acid synthetase